MAIEIEPDPVIPFLRGSKKPDYYDGLLIKADQGLHAQLTSIVEQRNKNRDIRILDIAAGEGALSLRLYEHGYTKIEAVDRMKKEFRYGDRIPFYELDLNDKPSLDDFVEDRKRRYDLILGIETIEHLENPWQYLRALRVMLDNRGTIILSTPNISSLYAKLHFVLRDRFFQFDEPDLSYYHINPISAFELETICRAIGLKIIERVPGGLYPLIWRNPDLRFSILYSISNILLYPFSRGMKFGWCSISILEKTGR